MTIMTIRIPDDVAEAFAKAFEGEDKDAIIAQFIRDGLASRTKPAKAPAREAVPDLVERFRKLREGMPAISQDEIRQLREEMRR
jgi:hypothetical protein